MKKTMFDILAPVYNRFSKLLFSEIREDIIDDLDLEDHDKILDVGGGTGAFLEKMLEKEPNVQGYLMDSSKKMVSKSVVNSIVLGKACKNPFDSNTFDFVLCTDALHHFKNKEESVKEMMRVVKPGGTIIIMEMNAKSPVTKMIKFGEKLLGEPSSFFTPDELSNLFSDGFELNVENINSYEYVLYAEKV